MPAVSQSSSSGSPAVAGNAGKPGKSSTADKASKSGKGSTAGKASKSDKSSTAGKPSVADIASKAEEPGGTARPHIVALANFKGGVGKTTTAINLAASLAELGHRVLVVDLDAQANATAALFLRGFATHTVGDWLLGQVPAAEAIRPWPAEAAPDQAPLPLHLLPAHVRLADQEEELRQRPAYEHLLARALAPLAPAYDFMLLDCPPSLGPMTRMALCAATAYVVPCLAEKFSFDGLRLLTQLAAGVTSRHNPALRLAGIVFTQYHPGVRNNLHQDVVLATEHVYGPAALLPAIRKDVTLAQAQRRGLPALRLRPDSNAVADYRALTQALLAALAG